MLFNQQRKTVFFQYGDAFNLSNGLGFTFPTNQLFFLARH